MAGNIKGITIELDGNTTRLTDSLKKSETAARDASKSIREIEKALKFNPGNTELVAQQQRNLQKQIEATKEKLSVLKSAEQEVKAQFESGNLGADKYEAFQREIITTESKLGTLEGKLKSSQDEQKRLSDATNGLTTIFEKSGKSVDDFADLIGKDVVEAFKKGEGTSAQMEEALQKVGEEMLGTGGDAEKLNDRLEKLGDGVSLDELEKSAKDSGEWVDKLGDEAEETGKQVDEIGDSSVKIAGLDAAINLFGKLKDAVGAAFGAISDAWSRVDEGQDIIVSKTGAVGQAAEEMGETFNRVYSKIPADAETVGNAIGEVSTQFGLQGEALEETSEKLIKYADINGTDVTNATQQARAAMDQFGLSGKDLNGVLDAVTKTGQDTGVSVDRLFESVTKGAPVLKNMGLSFEESVTLMGQFEQSGIDSTKSLSYLTKAQATAAKENKSLTEVLSEFTQTANSSASETEKLNRASELFGTKGGALMLAAAEQGKLDFENLASAATTTGGAVEATYHQMLDPADQFKVASQNIDLALSSIGTNVQTALAPAIQTLVGWIQKASEWFANLDPRIQVAATGIVSLALAILGILTVVGIVSTAISAATPVITAMGAALTAVKTAIAGFFTFVASNPIVLVITAIIAAAVLLIKNWDTVKAKAQEVWAKVTEAWNNLKQSLGEIVDAIKEKVSAVWDAVKSKTEEIWNGIKDTISKIWDGIKTAVTNAIDTVKTKVSSVWDAIKTTTGNVWNGIKSTISSAWESIKGAVTNAINAVKSTVTNIWNAIKTTTGNVWNGIQTTITSVWNGIKSGVTSAINAVKSTVTNVWNGIKSTTTNVWNGIKSTITNVVNGIKNTVTNVFNKVKNTVTGIWNGIVGFIRNIHIPLPHFNMSGSINPFSGNFPPRLSIRWYKEGGIFDSPSLIGVGEAGSEAVVPTHKLDAFFDAALKRIGATPKSVAQDSGVNIIIQSMEVRDDTDITKIATELSRLITRQRRTRHV